MAIIHLIQQGKGGVGKSLIASLLYQSLSSMGKEVYAYDTDPVNNTFAGYKEFNVVTIDIMKGNNIDKGRFDILWEKHIMELPKHAHAVIDNGASSFVALSSYLDTSDALEVLREEGHTVYFHSVITGGQPILDTLGGFKVLAENFPDTPKVLWLNPYFGEIAMDGKSFENFKVYEEYSKQVFAIIKLPFVDDSTLSQNLEELFAKRYSFDAGINSANLGIMAKSRLKKHRTVLFNLIGTVPFYEESI